jgi:diguanylate cyclase (GGDEF)-like protein/PAS domain S-box-containing protein
MPGSKTPPSTTVAGRAAQLRQETLAEPAVPALAASGVAAQLLTTLLGNSDFEAACTGLLAALKQGAHCGTGVLLEFRASASDAPAAVLLARAADTQAHFVDQPRDDAGRVRLHAQLAAMLDPDSAALVETPPPDALGDDGFPRERPLLAVPLSHRGESLGMLLLAGGCDARSGLLLDDPLHPLIEAAVAMLLWRRQRQAWADSEHRLEDERARLRSVIDSLPDPVAIKNADGVFTDCNEVFADYLGRTRLQVIGRSSWELFPEDVAERFERDDREVFGRSAAVTRMHWHTRTDTGERSLVQIHKRPLRGGDGATTGVIMAAHDITELYHKSERERLSAQVFATSSEGLAITDAEGVIVAANPALLAMSGRQEADLVGLPWTELDLELGEGAGASLLPPEGMRGEGWLVDVDGMRRPVWRSIAAVREQNGFARSFVLAYLNIAELVDAREHLDHIAHHDALTGLPNRMYLQKELSRTIARARQVPSAFALLFVDIDSFKTVNDSLGHSLGDELLRAVAVRLRRALRDSDRVARIGGDEFVLLLPGSHGVAGAERVASKVMAAFVEPFDIGGTILFQTPSIGISLYPGDGEDAETLIRNADAAMYAAKAAGRNCFRFYSSELTAAASERLTFETAMRRALVAEEFEPYFQPIHGVGAAAGQVVAAEVLLRWNSAELGAVPPDRFIPMAEASGLIVQIGDWVLSRALAQLASWREQGHSLPRLAVNVSIRQLERPEFAARVAHLLHQYELSSASLELEITETALMQQEGQGCALAQLQALRDLGVQIAIDDFGTGYSSMSRLHAMPVDRIKIDRSFFAARGESEVAGPITRAIAAIAQELGLRLTAEGVESALLMRRAAALGCDEAQGFHLGRPMPAVDFQRSLGARRRGDVAIG